MKAALIALGTSLLKDIADFLKSKVAKISIATGLFYLIINLIPFELSLDNDIIETLTNGFADTFFKNLSFILPIDFIFKCILISFLSKYVSNFLSLLHKIFEYILQFFNKES